MANNNEQKQKDSITAQKALRGAPTRTQMIEGVYMNQYRYKQNKLATFEWVVENLRFNNLQFKMDFTVSV